MKIHKYKDGTEMLSTDRSSFEYQGDTDYLETREATDEEIQEAISIREQQLAEFKERNETVTSQATKFANEMLLAKAENQKLKELVERAEKGFERLEYFEHSVDIRYRNEELKETRQWLSDYKTVKGDL